MEISLGRGEILSVDVGDGTRRQIGAGLQSKAVVVYDIDEESIVFEYTDFCSPPSSIKFTKDPDVIVVGLANGEVYRLDMVRSSKKQFGSHSEEVTAIGVSEDNLFVATGSEDGAVVVWELSTGKEVSRFYQNNKRITTLAFAKKGATLAAGDAGGRVALFFFISGDYIRSIIHVGSILSICFHPVTKFMAVAASDKTVRFWNIKSFLSRGRNDEKLFSYKFIMFVPKEDPDCPLLAVSEDAVQIFDHTNNNQETTRELVSLVGLRSVGYNEEDKRITIVSLREDSTIVVHTLTVGELLHKTTVSKLMGGLNQDDAAAASLSLRETEKAGNELLKAREIQHRSKSIGEASRAMPKSDPTSNKVPEQDTDTDNVLFTSCVTKTMLNNKIGGINRDPNLLQAEQFRPPQAVCHSPIVEIDLNRTVTAKFGCGLAELSVPAKSPTSESCESTGYLFPDTVVFNKGNMPSKMSVGTHDRMTTAQIQGGDAENSADVELAVYQRATNRYVPNPELKRTRTAAVCSCPEEDITGRIGDIHDFANLVLLGHNTALSVLAQRASVLEAASENYRSGKVAEAISIVLESGDDNAICDFLSSLDIKTAGINLEQGCVIADALVPIIEEGSESQAAVGVSVFLGLAKAFYVVIFRTISAHDSALFPMGSDITFEERYRKCVVARDTFLRTKAALQSLLGRNVGAKTKNAVIDGVHKLESLGF